MTLILKIGRRSSTAAVDIADAAAQYSRARDTSGEGASTFPIGKIVEGNKVIAHISYNGRVWEPKPWQPGDTPIA